MGRVSSPGWQMAELRSLQSFFCAEAWGEAPLCGGLALRYSYRVLEVGVVSHFFFSPSFKGKDLGEDRPVMTGLLAQPQTGYLSQGDGGSTGEEG